MIIYASYLSTEHLISQENNVLLIFWFSPLRVTRIVITGTVLNYASSAWALQILYIPFYPQSTDEGKADNVFWPKSSPSSWRFCSQGKRAQSHPQHFIHPESFLTHCYSLQCKCSSTWTLRFCKPQFMGAVGEQTLGRCSNEAGPGFCCGFPCLLESLQ